MARKGERESEPLTVGALARASGLTVRTLHHYDAIGLLVPSERSASGRRRYGAQEVARLYRILALRRFGLGLAQITELLDGHPDLRAAVSEHLTRVDRTLADTRRLRDRLAALAERLADNPNPDLDQFLSTIEEMTAPTDARLRPLAEQWRALIEQFTGGDPGIRNALTRMYREQSPELLSRGAVDGETMAYMRPAMQALEAG